MPFTLTPDTFDSLWAESEQNGQASCPDTDIIDQAILPHVGRFWSCHTPLQPGLELAIQEWEMLEDLLHSTETEEDTGTGLIFNLSGKVQTNLHGLTGDIEETVGHYQFENGSGIAETELWSAGEPFRRLYLNADPFRLFSGFRGDRLSQLPTELQQTLNGNHRPYYQSHRITPEMYRVLEQILHCPYEGVLKQLYLQGKAWELMALSFAPLSAAPQLAVSIKPRAVEQIHAAREILMGRLDEPPSLSELARQVGLNEFSLRQGFREVFGTTVFRYLHESRLEVACQLLVTNKNLRIKEVARRVGFANWGYFAAAFRKKYGLNPKDYRLQQK